MRDFCRPGRSPLHAAEAAVATSHPLSSQAAYEVLRAGGNAVDAALAAVAVQCVVDPLMTGLGGDCFALYLPKGAERPIAINGSGRAPMAAEAARLRAEGEAIQPTSPHAVTVPGAVACWARLAADHGTRPLEELLAPAIRCAEEGYLVQPRVAYDWARDAERVAIDPDARALFLPQGEAPSAGTRMRNPKLAATLRRVAAEGAAGFYQGPVAEDIVGKLRTLGGLHTLDDFAAAAPEYVEPVSTGYRGYQVYECPPNGQGLAALMMLNVIDSLDVGDLPEVERLHLFAEVCKQAYRHRDALFGDPAETSVPVEWLLSAEWSGRARQAIDPQRAGEPTVWPEPAHRDTVYLCVVDREGNAISLINSIFQGFGSGILAPESGVLLHNRGLSFKLEEGHPNVIAPAKRPMHTIIPGMLMKDGAAVAPFGVMGGHYQAMGHVELLTGIIDRGLDVQEALDAPRSFGYGGVLQMENAFPESVRDALSQRGHVVEVAEEAIGGGQAIWIDRTRGTLVAGSDPRKDGCALGF